MVRRRAARIDANQPELVEYIRKLGGSFQHTHTVPGALDGIVGFQGLDQRVEIKDPSQSSQKLTTMEIEVFNTWRGRPPVVLMTRDDCRQLLQSMQDEAYSRQRAKRCRERGCFGEGNPYAG